MPLEQRFDMEHGIRGERFRSASGLWMATDRADGEPYLLWLIEKTGTAVDRDVSRILAETVRRIRGVLARKAAREVLLEVIDLVEDDREIGIRLAGADGTLSTLTGRSRRILEDAARTLSGRISIWRQIARLVRGLGHLHAADLVHGGIADGAIFTANVEPLELKLGGYEGCVHVGSLGSGGAGLLRPGAVISHSQDWRDLGSIATKLLIPSDAEAGYGSTSGVRVPAQWKHLGERSRGWLEIALTAREVMMAKVIDAVAVIQAGYWRFTSTVS